MKSIIALLILATQLSFALEVDEKLTVRVLKTSETKKTLMVNRGVEDGLAEGDHAKFVTTSGIVARGVCLKVSPTRSVWSVYRLVNSELILNDAVMTLKITPPVKITKDDSQSLVKEDLPSKTTTGELGIPLAEGANDLSGATTGDEQQDLKDLQEEINEKKNLAEENKEIFTFVNISGLTSVAKTDAGDTKFRGSNAHHEIGLGGEIYSRFEKEWYSRFSLLAGINLTKNSTQSYTGAQTENDGMDVYAGTNWHFKAYPWEMNTFIPYLHLSGFMGNLKSKFQTGNEAATENSLSTTGSSFGFSLGGGYKFYHSSGFGARILIDYVYRTEKFKEDTTANKYIRTTAGPRLMIGLSYRF